MPGAAMLQIAWAARLHTPWTAQTSWAVMQSGLETC